RPRDGTCGQETDSLSVALLPVAWSLCDGSSQRYEFEPRRGGFTDADAVLVLDRVRVAIVDQAVPVHRCREIVRPLWLGPPGDDRLVRMLTDGATVTVLAGPAVPPLALVPRYRAR